MAGTDLDKVALQAGIKTTKSVVELFFASHIESFKSSLREKYLQNRISDKNLEELLETYLSTLHKQCHTLSTIIFPQKEIPLESIYEPLLLTSIDRYDGKEEDYSKNIDLLIHDDFTQNMLLIDTAGMGKSTVSKYLILRILQNKLHSKIPIFVELRKIDNEETLLEFIVKEMNPHNRKNFTVEMLIMLMEKGKFVFFFDGFDEVSDDKAKELGEEISSLSKIYANNLTLLTSREQSYIPTLHNQIACTFKPLVLQQIKSLLLKYDDYASIDVGKQLIAHENFKTLNYELFNTPLMVNLLYKSFGYNHTIDDNVVTFYNEMFDALYKGHDLTKAGFKRKKASKLNYEAFKTLFNAFSFVALFENKASFKNKAEVFETINKACKISSIELESKENFLIDLLNSVPLLTRDGREYKFLHKTIMEFFAAEFLNYSEKSHDLFEKIKKKELMNSFKKCFEFLYEINKSLYIEEVGKEFLVEYIAFCKKPENQKYNDAFKSVLFLYEDLKFGVTSTTRKLLDVGLRYRLDGEKEFIKSLPTNSFKWGYHVEKFFRNLTNIKKYGYILQPDKDEIDNLLAILETDKIYTELILKDIPLEKSNLLFHLLISHIYYDYKSYFDISKCQALLDSIDNKLDILD